MTAKTIKEIAYHNQKIAELLNQKPIKQRETKAIRQARIQEKIDKIYAGK